MATSIVNFLLKAAVVYFLIIRPFANVATRLAARSAAPPDVPLLTEIRDLLKTRNVAGV